MSNKIGFKTERPILLSSQIKTYGEHAPVEITEDDMFKLLVSGATNVKTIDEENNETLITWENVTDYFPDMIIPENIKKELETDSGEEDVSSDTPTTPPTETPDAPSEVLSSEEEDSGFFLDPTV